jgi:hypothetical protein
MRILLVVLSAGLLVFGGAQAYAGNGQGGNKARKQCEANCHAEFKICKADAGDDRGKISKCELRDHYCLKKC